jgi:hypothetical protein
MSAHKMFPITSAASQFEDDAKTAYEVYAYRAGETLPYALLSPQQMTAWREVVKFTGGKKRGKDDEDALLWPDIFVARCKKCRSLLECDACRRVASQSAPDESGVWV